MTDGPTPTELLRARSAHLVPTAIQLRVLELRSYGLDLQQVAFHMGISHDTVKTHSRRLNARLGALNGQHAVRIGFERGYLRHGPPTVGQVSLDDEDLDDEVDP